MARVSNILLVDDDHDCLDILDLTLRSKGLQIYRCHSGKQALEVVLHDSSIELVVSDVNMADGTGPGLAKALRTLGKNLPIIFLTSDRTFTMDEGLKAGGNSVFYKPTEILQLPSEVSKWLATLKPVEMPSVAIREA